jgi:hypothetical protein
MQSDAQSSFVSNNPKIMKNNKDFYSVEKIDMQSGPGTDNEDLD